MDSQEAVCLYAKPVAEAEPRLTSTAIACAFEPLLDASGNWVVDGSWLAEEAPAGDFPGRIDALAHDVTDDGLLQPRSVLTRWWPNAASTDGAGIVTVPGAGSPMIPAHRSSAVNVLS